MGKIYSWFIKVDDENREQYAYIIDPDNAKNLIGSGSNPPSQPTDSTNVYIGTRLSQLKVDYVKRWAQTCHPDHYKFMFNKLVLKLNEKYTDVEMGSVDDYDDVAVPVETLRGPQGRGVKRIEYMEDIQNPIYNYYKIIFDDDSYDTFTMPRPRDGEPGPAGATPDVPVVQITKTVYKSGLNNETGEIETPQKPNGGDYSFSDVEFTCPDGWVEDNSNLTPPVFSSSRVFYSTNEKTSPWSEPLQMTGDDGKPGTDGVTTEFIYRLTNDNLNGTVVEDENNTKKYIPYFKYYEFTNGIYKEVSNLNNIEEGKIDIVNNVPNEYTKEYLKVWSIPNDISSDNCSVDEDEDSIESIIEESTKYLKVTINDNTFHYYVWAEYKSERVPSGWTDAPSGVDEDNKTEWCATRRCNTITRKWGAWSKPQIWSKYGEKGEDGDGVEYIYYLGDATPPLNPTPFGYEDKTTDYQNRETEWQVPTDQYTNIHYENVKWEGENTWYDEAPNVSPEKMYLWVASRKYRKYDGVFRWGPFSEPALWSKYGETGKSGIIVRELYKLTNSSSEKPQKPSNSSYSDWSVGFPSGYIAGRNVVWGTRAELDVDTNQFSMGYNLVYPEPDNAIIGINTRVVTEIPTNHITNLKYLLYNNEYYYWDATNSCYIKYEDENGEAPKNSLSENDRKYLVVDKLPNKENKNYEYLKCGDSYYIYSASTKRYEQLNGVPNDIVNGIVKGVNTIEVTDSLPSGKNGYEYVLFRNEYYTWSESSWCEPYLVTGIKGDPASPVDYNIDFFLYYDVNRTPSAPFNGQTVIDSTTIVSGMTINGTPDYWRRLPLLDNPNDASSQKRWYRCTGVVKAEDSTTIWGEVCPAGGRDGENGKLFEKRYCVTYTINSPSLNRNDREPSVYYNNKQMGWFLLDDVNQAQEFNELLIDGCPPRGGAIWEIQAEINPNNNNLINGWSKPTLHSGYPGEKGPEGPAGVRGVTGIPGASIDILYCLGTFDEQSGKDAGYFFDEILVDNNKTYYGNGYFGETPIIEADNNTLKNWFRTPPATEYIVVNNQNEFNEAIKYANLGRVIDFKKIINENGVTLVNHNFYLVYETNIPSGSTSENLYTFVYGSEVFDRYIKKGEKYDFVAENCYYKWNDELGKYELLNVLSNSINTEKVKNVNRVPLSEVKDFEYLKIVNYYKWESECYVLYSGNYKIEAKVIKEEVIGDENAKKWQPYLWSTQGNKQEAYINTYAYLSGETPFTGYTIPNGIIDINARNKVSLDSTLLKDSRYKYLIDSNTGLFYQWSDSANNYVLLSTLNTYRPSDLVTDINMVNVIEYVGENKSTPGFFMKLDYTPDNADNTNTTIEDSLPSDNTKIETEYVKVGDDYYHWYALGVTELPSFNLNDCVYLQQKKGNHVYFYEWNDTRYTKCVNTPSNATRENTLVLTPDSTIDYFSRKISEQYQYFKKDKQRHNEFINRTERYYTYYSWKDLSNEELELKTVQVDWCTPFRLQGSNGLVTAGNRGQVVYPRGVYNANEVYVTTSTKAPYVLDPNDGLFYVYNIVDKPWVGKLPENYDSIMEEPHDVSKLNTLTIQDKNYTPNWYQKNYEFIQQYNLYEWNETRKRYVNRSIPSGANSNNTEILNETYNTLPQSKIKTYIIFKGQYYKWSSVNGYEKFEPDFSVKDLNIKEVENIVNIVVEDADYLLCNGKYYVWDTNNNSYTEITDIYNSTTTDIIEIYSLTEPGSTMIAGFKYVKSYCYYAWINNGYKKVSDISRLTANNFAMVNVLPDKKIGYKYFNIPEQIGGGKIKDVYYIWNFDYKDGDNIDTKYIIASTYKYSNDGIEGNWIEEQGDINTPATNYANAISNNTEPAWVRFEHFDALYASIGIIANGMIGSSVYNNEFMYSQQGKGLNNSNQRVESSNYEDFLSAYQFDGNIGTNGAWTYNGTVVNEKSVNPYDDANKFWPNVCINFKTGQMWLSCGAIKFGAFANNTDNSDSNNITTQDIIKEWGDDNKLSPMERSTLKKTFTEFNSKYKETKDAYNVIFGEENSDLNDAYDKACNAYSAHTINTAIEVDVLPEGKIDAYNYIKYKGKYFKYNDNVDSIDSYQKVEPEVEVDYYNDIPTGNMIVKVKNNTINNNVITHYAGFYKVTGPSVEKINAEIVLGIPSTNQGEYIILQEKGNVITLYEYKNINTPYATEVSKDDNGVKVFTSGDTMDIYTTGDNAYSSITEYYNVQSNVINSINVKINTDINKAQSDLTGITGTLNTWASDKYLSPSELKMLNDEYIQFQNESGITQSHAELLGLTGESEYTVYIGTCTLVNDTFNYYLDKRNYSKDGTIEILNDNNDVYKNYSNIEQYYIDRKALSKKIDETSEKNISNAQTNINKAINVITGASADKRIYSGECVDIKAEYDSFIATSGNTVDKYQKAVGGEIKNSSYGYEVYTAYTGACASANTAFRYYSGITTNNSTNDALEVPYIEVIIDNTNEKAYSHIYKYYDAKDDLEKVINEVIKNNVNDVKNDADRALGVLGGIASDDVISISEVATLKEIKQQIESETGATIASAVNIYNQISGITTLSELAEEISAATETYKNTYSTALTVLGNYIKNVKTDYDSEGTGVDITPGIDDENMGYGWINKYYEDKFNLVKYTQSGNTEYINLIKVEQDKTKNTVSTLEYLNNTFEQIQDVNGAILSNFLGVKNSNDNLKTVLNGSLNDTNFKLNNDDTIVFASGIPNNHYNGITLTKYINNDTIINDYFIINLAIDEKVYVYKNEYGIYKEIGDIVSFDEYGLSFINKNQEIINIEKTEDIIENVPKYKLASTIITNNGILINDKIDSDEIIASKIAAGTLFDTGTIKDSELVNSDISGQFNFSNFSENSEFNVDMGNNDQITDTNISKKASLFQYNVTNDKDEYGVWNINGQHKFWIDTEDLKDDVYTKMIQVISNASNAKTLCTFVLNPKSTYKLCLPEFKFINAYSWASGSKGKSYYAPVYYFYYVLKDEQGNEKTIGIKSENTKTSYTHDSGTTFVLEKKEITIGTGYTQVKIMFNGAISIPDRWTSYKHHSVTTSLNVTNNESILLEPINKTNINGFRINKNGLKITFGEFTFIMDQGGVRIMRGDKKIGQWNSTTSIIE